MNDKEDDPYELVLFAPDGRQILQLNYWNGAAIPDDLHEDIHEAYAKHRKERGLTTGPCHDEA
tara:strand:+ start:1332 stop:1520 length:189 start_codon:yes stop_codon:yes gene_type:complete